MAERERAHLTLAEAAFELSENERARFFSKIGPPQTDGCQLWTRGKSSDGYGVIGLRGTILYCHRLAWAVERGPIPAGMRVLHTCDVRACVNPEHLFLGSQQSNLTDMARKERGTKSKKGLPFGANLTPSGRFKAQVKAGGVNHSLGTYDTAEEASAVAQRFKAAVMSHPPPGALNRLETVEGLLP